MSEALFPLDKLFLGLCVIIGNLESKLWGDELNKLGGKNKIKERYIIKKIAMFSILYITTRSWLTAFLLTLAIVIVNYLID